MDSTNETEPSGEMPVSRLLIEHIEPLFIVRLFFMMIALFPYDNSKASNVITFIIHVLVDRCDFVVASVC